MYVSKHDRDSAPMVAGPGVARAVPEATLTDVQARDLSASIVSFAAGTTVGQARVAESLGVSRKLVWNWTTPEQPHEIDLRQLLRAEPSFAESVLLQALAAVRRRLRAELPAEIGIERRARRVTVAHGQVMEAVESAYEDDGAVDADEASDIVRAVREERARLGALEQEAALVAAAGGIEQ